MGLQIRSNQNEPWAYMWFKEKRKGNLNKLSIFLLNATLRKNLTLSEFVFAQQNILTGTSKYRITCSVCTVLCIIYLCDSCIPLTAALLNHWLFCFLTLTTFVSDGQKSHRLKWGKCGGAWAMSYVHQQLIWSCGDKWQHGNRRVWLSVDLRLFVSLSLQHFIKSFQSYQQLRSTDKSRTSWLCFNRLRFRFREAGFKSFDVQEWGNG